MQITFDSQIKMNTLFDNINGIKISRRDKNTHKDMQIPVDIYQINKKVFVIVKSKTHVNFNLKIIYGYHFLINLSQTSWFLK